MTEPGTRAPRDAALQALCDVDVDGAFARQAFERVSGWLASRDDRRLVHALVMGVTRRRLTLDWVLAQVSGRSPAELAPWLRNLLRMGAFQVMYMERVHPAVAVDSSVRLARQHGHEGTVRFVNGVLRALDRAHREQRLSYPDRLSDPVGFLSVVHSLPEWLASRWLARLGLDRAEAIARIINEPPRCVVRSNLLRVTRAELVDALKAAGVACSVGHLAPEAVVLEDAAGAPAPDLPQFRDGLFTFQDESSMLAARAVEPRPGEVVVDACAAPGGKTTHLAELMGDQGTVVALEPHDHRVRLIEDNVARLGIKSVSARVADASRPPADLVGVADRVLVDAPCTGTGALARHADARWKRQPKDIAALTDLQAAILDGAATLARRGGRLVYCTCSLEPEENEGVVRAFLKRRPDYRPAPPGVAVEPLAYHGPEPFVYVYPDLHGADGFFIAAMTRE